MENAALLEIGDCMTESWVHCPICGGKTKTKVREDTIAYNLPVLCKICKRESVVDIKGIEVKKSIGGESTLHNTGYYNLDCDKT